MPLTIQLRSVDDAMVGAMVLDGGVQRIGLFAAEGTPQASVRYTANYAAGQAGVHVLTDLMPQTPYLIARDGVSLGTASASSDGVLVFHSSGGGQFTVRGSGRAARTAW
jgi:hypothetical protein